MNLRLALAAATCLALPIAAHAQPVTGPYVSLGAGTSILSPFNVSNANGSGKIWARPDYAGDIAVGYGFGDGLRVELNGDYARDTVRKIKGIAPATGGIETYGPMVNALYDMNVGLPIFPYVGAGVGYQWSKFDSAMRSTTFGDVNGNKGSFAYNLIAGVAYPVAMVPGLSVTAEYKFTQLTASRNYSESGIGGTLRFKVGQQSSHTFLLGLRYQLFNPQAPAPAVAPEAAPVAAAPAPAPARTYLVFFDWDKSDLTPRATQIIAQAASDSKTQSTTSLDVSGYTDTSGTADYNQGLSLRRAKAVAGQLVTDGVPASEIQIQAFGETHLLVPTGPGVREPQNRRVEIVLN